MPWLASPVGPYEDLAEEQGGRLVEDDEWFEAIDELIRARRDRAKLAKRARRGRSARRSEELAAAGSRLFLDTIEASVRSTA